MRELAYSKSLSTKIKPHCRKQKLFVCANDYHATALFANHILSIPLSNRTVKVFTQKSTLWLKNNERTCFVLVLFLFFFVSTDWFCKCATVVQQTEAFPGYLLRNFTNSREKKQNKTEHE